MIPAWMERTSLLLGDEKLERLQQAHVLVVGLGGVGAYAAEMLVRAGIGRMTIADADVVSLSNINRQLVALHSTIGRLPKLALIKGTLDRVYAVVSSMGAGAKTDQTQMEIADIAKTHHCPLAHMLRKRLHKIGIRSGFRAVFSPEPIREGAMIVCEEENKKSNVGTISYLPALFGIGCASVVIRDLLGEMK